MADLRCWYRGVRIDLADLHTWWVRRRTNRRWIENSCPHAYEIGESCGLCGGTVTRAVVDAGIVQRVARDG